ncbi:hypothetical protein TNCV_4733521 [Trichonephila clavipes]|nr:hypothetical protein TNCV_4733521 [Trichonephila clavipes]
MGWCIIGRLESWQTQRAVEEAVGVEISVIVCKRNPKAPYRTLPPYAAAVECLGLIRATHSARSLPSLTVRDVEIALLEELNGIPQSLIDNLIASMLNKCSAVLAVQGGHTPY